jgi:hypothetical protein|tara:strand:- start:883 stop:1503 length:621 start_codon:yes stop_codon:yes gene_type:complete
MKTNKFYKILSWLTVIAIGLGSCKKNDDYLCFPLNNSNKIFKGSWMLQGASFGTASLTRIDDVTDRNGSTVEPNEGKNHYHANVFGPTHDIYSNQLDENTGYAYTFRKNGDVIYTIWCGKSGELLYEKKGVWSCENDGGRFLNISLYDGQEYQLDIVTMNNKQMTASGFFYTGTPYTWEKEPWRPNIHTACSPARNFAIISSQSDQ